MNYGLYLSLLAAAIAIYGMVDILMARMSNKNKMIWFAIVVVLPLVGALIYFIRKPSLRDL